MSLKESLLRKVEFKKATVKVNGMELEVRELSGLERMEMSKIDDAIDSGRYVWNTCVLSEGEKMSEEEFNQAYNFNHMIVDKVVSEILKLSGLTGEAEEQVVKN